MRDNTSGLFVGFKVEFIGGPFDGHVIWFAETPLFISLPVNENMCLALEGKPSGTPVPMTSIAVYEQEEHTGKLCYVYRCSFPPGQIRAESWRG